MNIPLLTNLVHLIEEILKAETPVIGKAAVAGVAADPKVQAVQGASVALLAAAQSLKAAVNAPTP